MILGRRSKAGCGGYWRGEMSILLASCLRRYWGLIGGRTVKRNLGSSMSALVSDDVG